MNNLVSMNGIPKSEIFNYYLPSLPWVLFIIRSNHIIMRMTLLEVITNASVNSAPIGSEYPIVLNPDAIFTGLKPKHENPNPSSLLCPFSGWEISKTDAEIIDLSKKFVTKLKRKLKDTNNFHKEEFIGILIPFLEKLKEKTGIRISSSASRHAQALVEKVGFLMGQDVGRVVSEACVNLEIWELVETLIVKSFIEHSSYSNLVACLVRKNKPDLLSLCIQHSSDLTSSDLLAILKYYLCPSKEAISAMANVREEWNSQAKLAIENASNRSFTPKISKMAKDASILVMIAYDGFSVSELCLHYLLASSHIDEVVLSAAISKLNGKEMMNLIRYLGKWIKKYKRFPQASPCPKASSELGLKVCDWVPKLENVANCLGIVLDENFSSLVLLPEFHEELKSIEEVVSSFAVEAKHSSLIAVVVQKLRFGMQK